MTHNGLPPLAVGTGRSVPGAAYTSTTVRILEKILRGNQNVVQAVKKGAASGQGSKVQVVNARASKARGDVPRKKASVTILEDHEEETSTLSPRERYRLATDTVNGVLKALGSKVQSPPKRPKRDQAGASDSESELHQHLDKLSVNTATDSQGQKCLPLHSSSTVKGNTSDLLITAKCGSIAFAILRAVGSQEGSQRNVPHVQLEQGMSVFIGQLIALGLYDTAIGELQVLKTRLDTFKAPLTQRNGNSRPPGKFSKKGTLGADRQPLPDLLLFENTKPSGQLLNLIITFQLQVLKVIAAIQSSSALESAIKYLNLDCPSSPATFIEQQIDHQSQQSMNRAAQQLESLSRLLSRLCIGPGSVERRQTSSKDLLPSVEFQYCNLVLEIRLKWWKLAGHHGDALEHVARPCEKHLASFRRYSTWTETEKYNLAQDHIKRLLIQLHTLQAERTSVRSVEQALSKLQLLLSDTAQACSDFLSADHWLNEAHRYLRLIDAPKSQICTFMCKRASLSVQSQSGDGNKRSMINAMKDLSTALNQDLGADPGELMEVVSTLNSFRKSVLALVRTHTKTPEVLFEVTLYGSRIISSGVILLSSIIKSHKKQPDGQSVQPSSLSAQQLVLALSAPFIESLAFLSKMSANCSSKDWESLALGLRCGVEIAQKLNKESQPEQSVPMETCVPSSCFVSVSNAYWCRFLNRRQQGAQCAELELSLAASIDAIKDQATSVQDAALMTAKLEKQASLYESAKRNLEAAEVYAEIVKVLIANGSVTLAATAAATRSLQTVRKSSVVFGLLSSSLQGYIQNMCNLSIDAHASLSIFDPTGLATSEKGIILEYQLIALDQSNTRHDSPSLSLQLIEKLASALFSIYTVQEYPIRRLRMSMIFVQLATRYRSSLILDKHGRLSQDLLDIEDVPLGRDMGLERFHDHLRRSQKLCNILSSKVTEVECLDQILTSWTNILQNHKDWTSLESCVDDVQAWMLHLDTLVDYLEVRGLELQRISALKIMVKLHEIAVPVQPDALVAKLNALGAHYTRLGFSSHAGMVLHRAQQYVSATAISPPIVIDWHLVYAEYLLSVGNTEKSESHLVDAQRLYDVYDHKSLRKRQAMMLLSNAAGAYVQLSMSKGDFTPALYFCRLRVKLLHRVWPMTNECYAERNDQKSTGNQISGIEAIAQSMSSLSLIKSSQPTAGGAQRSDFEMHILIPHLFDALTSLAEIFAHEGLLPECQYYMEQSAKVAYNAPGTSYQTRYHERLGHYLLRGANLVSGLSHLSKAESTWTFADSVRQPLALQSSLARKCLESLDVPSAISALGLADHTLELMMQADFVDRIGLQRLFVAISQPQSKPIPDTVRNTQSKTRSKSKVVSKSNRASSTTNSVTTSENPRRNELMALQYVKARLLRSHAALAIKKADLDQADSLLEQAAPYASAPLDRIVHTLNSAKLAIRRALAKMASDLVFSVVPESTTCCPSTKLASLSKETTQDKLHDHLGDLANSADTKGKTRKPDSNNIKTPLACTRLDFVELLIRSQEELNRIYTLAISNGSTVDLHTFVDGLMQSTMMLTAFPQSRAAFLGNPLFAMCVNEVGRSVVIERQIQVLYVERLLSSKETIVEWPSQRCSSVALSDDCASGDVTTFQTEYLDLIPESWMVLSLTLSDSCDEIRITKYRAHQSPFILNLPLGRHSQDRDDDEAFGFRQGKAELRNIIALANYSTHDAPDTSFKGARTAWWDARAALDARLKDLLVNIESIWFGGFRGILGDSICSPELLSRFQQSFYNILDKYLPSRQRPMKARKDDRVVLDNHILELLVTIGNPNERDLDEELLDLLYFVIDILQFHGERNAYDEVDFDAITVELLDALRQYHEKSKAQGNTTSAQHTILILDKALHCFPWESMPCMKGQAVSRLPSLRCLRQRILHMRSSEHPHSSISAGSMLIDDHSNGTFVMNPGGDLTATQARFEKPLEKLSDWDAIVNRKPSEEEFKQALESKKIFLYFGHGSGSQYIRSRTIQKLEKCAVTLLMGCSSGALTEAGEFESYGTPINYMQAGCPALAATLWDVTDKDIDRFSQTVLEKWGLFEESPDDILSSPVKKAAKPRGKGKAKQPTNMVSKHRSLDQAVAESRDICNMKYLNGAATVVYGIPVTLC